MKIPCVEATWNFPLYEPMVWLVVFAILRAHLNLMPGEKGLAHGVLELSSLPAWCQVSLNVGLYNLPAS